MSRRLVFAANWKMNLGPEEARRFCEAFLAGFRSRGGVEAWFFPPAVSLVTVAQALRGHEDLRVGAQNVYWERAGAFTGEISGELARTAGASMALIGHSERRHLFGETDEMTGRKLRSVLASGLTPLLCVGETLAERQRGETVAVVQRQLAAALGGLDAEALARVSIAYEPVWAVGTGHNATPADASAVHREIRAWLSAHGPKARATVLYGGSVRRDNVRELLSEDQLDGVLVGGASLKVPDWLAIVGADVI